MSVSGVLKRAVLSAALMLVTACVAQTDQRELVKGATPVAPELAAAPPDQTLPSFVLTSGTNGEIAVGRLSRNAPPILVAPPGFVDTGEAITHTSTGVRLPKIHAGCRLAAFAPIRENVTGPASFAHGALAEYDCLPAQKLTYVTVSFESAVAFLKASESARPLWEFAHAFTERDSNTPQTACQRFAPNPSPLHDGFAATQCGVKWINRHDLSRRLMGTVTVVYGRGASYIRFTNTCAGDQCDNRPDFGRFVDTFDISGLKPELTP